MCSLTIDLYLLQWSNEAASNEAASKTKQLSFERSETKQLQKRSSFKSETASKTNLKRNFNEAASKTKQLQKRTNQKQKRSSFNFFAFRTTIPHCPRHTASSFSFQKLEAVFSANLQCWNVRIFLKLFLPFFETFTYFWIDLVGTCFALRGTLTQSTTTSHARRRAVEQMGKQIVEHRLNLSGSYHKDTSTLTIPGYN